DKDASTIPLDTPARNAIEGRCAHRFPGAQAEARVMPGASHGITDHDAFSKRAVIMCAGRADGEELFTLSCDQHCLCADVTQHQSAVGNVGHCNAFCEIGTGRFFRFLAHATSHFTGLEVRLAQASAMVSESI